MLKASIQTGPAKVHMVKKKDLEKMLDEYYELWGWDKKGVPRLKTLKKFGLEDVASELIKSGIILT